MNDEFQSINDRLPDMASALAQRIAAKQGNSVGSNSPPGIVDPYKLMVQKKNGITTNNEVIPEKIVNWPAEDVKKLQDYCSKMGILGFSSGRMPPLVALSLLKKQFGDDYSDVPLDKRLPEGYEKLGTISKYNQNYPYSEVINKKQIIHG